MYALPYVVMIEEIIYISLCSLGMDLLPCLYLHSTFRPSLKFPERFQIAKS